jgi:hypothetical protein
MDRFIVQENIRHFHRLLDGELEASQRQVIESLLAAEEAKLPCDPQPVDPAALPPDTPAVPRA